MSQEKKYLITFHFRSGAHISTQSLEIEQKDAYITFLKNAEKETMPEKRLIQVTVNDTQAYILRLDAVEYYQISSHETGTVTREQGEKKFIPKLKGVEVAENAKPAESMGAIVTEKFKV